MALRSPANGTALAPNATATTQPPLDNSTSVATDAFVNQEIVRSTATAPISITGGIYNLNVTGTGLQFVVFVSSGVITSILSIVNGGSGYAVGDTLVVASGNMDAVVRVTNVVGGVVQSGGVSVLYGGTGYTTGATNAGVRANVGAANTITLTGVLTSNATLILIKGTLIAGSNRLVINNNTTGAFSVSVFMSNGAGGTTGAGVILPRGSNNSSAALIQTDGVTDCWAADSNLVNQAVRTVTTTATAGQFDYTVLGNATGGAFTITLPAAASNPNRILAFKKIDSSANAVTVKGNAAELIDAANTNVLSAQYAAILIHCDGTQWWII